MPTNAEYAKINIACKDLGIDKYALLLDRYKVESSKQLTPRQTWDLLSHFKSLGWKPKRGGRKNTSPQYDDARARKIVALWITLHKAGKVRNGSDQALQKMVKRVTGVDNLTWCDGGQLNKVIEALKDWAKREQVDIE